MKVVKQRFSRTLTRSTTDAIWQKRFYDFNVWSKRKRVEKLRYMHRNLSAQRRDLTTSHSFQQQE